MLQWGHDRAVVELTPTGLGRWRRNWLQWGHDRAVVELKVGNTFYAGASRFNGATTARSWNFGLPN